MTLYKVANKTDKEYYYVKAYRVKDLKQVISKLMRKDGFKLGRGWHYNKVENNELPLDNLGNGYINLCKETYPWSKEAVEKRLKQKIAKLVSAVNPDWITIHNAYRCCWKWNIVFTKSGCGGWFTIYTVNAYRKGGRLYLDKKSLTEIYDHY